MGEPILIQVEKELPNIYNVQTVEHNTKEMSLKIKSRISQLVNHKTLVKHCQGVAEALNMKSVNLVLVDWEGKYLAGAKHEKGVEHND